MVSGIYAFGIHVDSSGNIYASDNSNHRIMKYTLESDGTYTATVVAGGNGNGSDNNQFSSPRGIHVDASGQYLCSRSINHRVMKWASGGSEGTVVAGGNVTANDWGGYSSGNATNQLNNPIGIHVDSSGNIYVADQSNHRVMKWAPGASVGTLVAGVSGSQGSGTDKLNNPVGLDVDASGNIYVADQSNHRVMKWAPGASIGIMVAGTGSQGSEINQLYNPYGVKVDSYGNLYVVDTSNHRIQFVKLSPEIEIVAGQTTGTLTLTAINDTSDEENETIISTPSTSPINATISVSEAKTITITDDDDPPTVTFALSAASIEENSSTDVTLTATISVVSAKAIEIPYTVEGTATITEEYTITASPITIAAGATTGTVTISTTGKDDDTVEPIETIILTLQELVNATTEETAVTINLISDDNPSVSAIALDLESVAEDAGVSVLTATISAAHSKLVTIPLTITGTATIGVDYSTAFVSKVASTVAGTGTQGSATNQLYNPQGIHVDASGNIYIADYQNYRVMKWAPGATSGTVLMSVRSNKIHVDASGNVYALDQNNHRIYKWNSSDSTTTTVAGTGYGTETNQLNYPSDFHVDSSGNIYVADRNNHRVMKWGTTYADGGTIVAGTGTAGSGATQLNNPNNIHVDSSGNIYVADQSNHRVMKWGTTYSGGGTIVAGTGTQGSATNQLYNPQGIDVDDSGNIYVADSQNHRVMKWASGAIQEK